MRLMDGMEFLGATEGIFWLVEEGIVRRHLVGLVMWHKVVPLHSGLSLSLSLSLSGSFGFVVPARKNGKSRQALRAKRESHCQSTLLDGWMAMELGLCEVAEMTIDVDDVGGMVSQCS